MTSHGHGSILVRYTRDIWPWLDTRALLIFVEPWDPRGATFQASDARAGVGVAVCRHCRSVLGFGLARPKHHTVNTLLSEFAMLVWRPARDTAASALPGGRLTLSIS